MDVDYVCSLDDGFAKRAKKELKEDPQNRQRAVRKLREWIEQHPHIAFPTGDVFYTFILLSFIHFCRVLLKNRVCNIEQYIFETQSSYFSHFFAFTTVIIHLIVKYINWMV